VSHVAGRRSKSPIHPPTNAASHHSSVLAGLSGPVAKSKATDTPQAASSSISVASRGAVAAAPAAGFSADDSGGIEDLVGSDDVSYATSVASLASPAGSARVLTGPSSTLRLPSTIDDSGIVDEAVDVSYAPSVEAPPRMRLPARDRVAAAPATAAPPSSFGAHADEEVIEDVVDGPDHGQHNEEHEATYDSERIDASWMSVVSGGAAERTGP
jgi:hypothetical protein